MPIEILIILEGFQPRLMNYLKFFDDRVIILYVVDRWIFERDINDGFLGEAFAVHLIFPYIPITGEDYFKAKEVELKKRLIRELLENLVLNFPELSRELYIKPEYFVYEAVLNRARLFPPMFHSLSAFLCEDFRDANLKRVMGGYAYALEELEREGAVRRLDGYVKISEGFAESIKGKKVRFISLLKSAQKALFLSLLGTFPKIFRVLSQNKEVLFKLKFFEGENLTSAEDPKAYLFMPTASGLVSLASQVDIEAFARKILLTDVNAKIEVVRLGGVLNDVYLVKVTADGEVKKIVAKSFKDWSGLKWFPLTLWTVGTKTFALLGQSRLERECAINQLLYSKGFLVPKLLGASSKKRLVFMEYLEGESLEKVVKRILSSKSKSEVEEDLKTVERVGETFAKIHALGVALGDAKPENILVGEKGEIYLLDFEQASRKGDNAWDIAEFLYYVGHYASPFTSTRQIELITKIFLKGYLGAGGSPKAVKAAGKPKYTKVFSVFALPHIIFTISNFCQKADRLGQKHGEA
ncbi:MAG: lipopolysaccharide kinase InaA family protein [Nitrososphaerota archaeon]|nr:lipopolysaccharide kinase InaA family protein [Nitrososphaerota archaeon]